MWIVLYLALCVVMFIEYMACRHRELTIARSVIIRTHAITFMIEHTVFKVTTCFRLSAVIEVVEKFAA